MGPLDRNSVGHSDSFLVNAAHADVARVRVSGTARSPSSVVYGLSGRLSRMLRSATASLAMETFLKTRPLVSAPDWVGARHTLTSISQG